MTEPPCDVTKLLRAWTGGDQRALDQLVPLVYAELRRVARNRLRRERPGQTLQPTALVNEAYMRLVRIRSIKWQNRAHFFALCGRLMRQILVDAARARQFAKRGGGGVRVTIDEALLPSALPAPDVVALDEALTALARMDARKSQVVEMRFFAGLSVEETAEALGVSTDTVFRDWKFARTWLYQELGVERRRTP
jgi:RNA polymerase sigma factor (TIGR02999 family)